MAVSEGMTEPKANISSAIQIENPAPMEKCTMSQLLQDVPIHSPRSIQRLFSQPEFGNLAFPQEIYAHCNHQRCEGVRRHIFGSQDRFKRGDCFYFFVVYTCTNCDASDKLFGLKAQRKDEKTVSGICTKIYQEPAFGDPIPRRLFHIIGETNREYFLQARRAIARGLGIGAYAYYRRIVENTKFELINSVLEVAQATNAPNEQIELLNKAQSETQFSKAIGMLRDVSAIPAVLLIDGHNPLSLLHDLLSEGIHGLSDEDCLERAKEAEIILCEIADRMQIAVTERKTVKAAITNILNRKADRKGTGTT